MTKLNMTKRQSVILGAAILIAVGACAKHHYSSSSSYNRSGPSYAAPAAVEVDAPPTGKPFPTPQAAIAALSDMAGLHDKAKVEELFGTGATEVLWSGDDVADVDAGKRVKAMIQEGVVFEDRSAEETVAVIGKDKWPLPFPLVKTPEGWRFDLDEGKDELLTRRIGKNELETIETMYEYVQAQKEYMATGRDGNPPAYAQKCHSSAGKHDGLYWETKEGEEASPFGEFVAEATKEGYAQPGDTPRAFHGYYYKILTAQGSHGPGGRKSYLDPHGLMIAGYAAVAWPADYGNSGITTFLVSTSGVVFEKNLGENTATLAAAITEYDPDSSWNPTARKPLPDDDDDN